MDITLDADTTFKLAVPEEHTTMAYVFEGEGFFGVGDNNQGKLVKAVQMVVFGDGNYLSVTTQTSTATRFILISGAPFHETIVPYGPFVMNTNEEIKQAFADLKAGTFVKDSKI
jgi:redox-sensitive bicupin YhaK (pirin superfamily)